MTQTGTVRPANEADVPAITAIYNAAVLHTTGTAEYVPVSEAARKAWLNSRLDRGYPVLVYEEDEEVRGFSALSPWVEREGYRFTAETAVYVRPEDWGRGLATLLMRSLLEEARQGPFRNLIARISSENEASLRVHRALGFETMAVLPELVYKFDRWIDIALLQLRL